MASGGWPLSYRDLDRVSDEVAVGLSRRGIGEGDVVALALPSVPEYVVAYVAIAKLGAITAGVNPRLAPRERSAVLAAAEPRLVLATRELAPETGEIVEVVPAGCAGEVLAGLRVPGEAPPALAEDPDRPVAIVFTSGTTGTPKGAVFATRALEHITAVDTGNRWGGGGAAIAATSFAHLGPMTKLPGNLRRGGTTHLMDRWRPADALRMIEEHRVSGIGGIPTQVALMLRDPAFSERDLSCVKVITIGGGPATPALVAAARQGFDAAVCVRYSCTEAGIGTGTGVEDPPEDAGLTVGRPQPGVRLTIRGEDGPLGPGEVGEVCLASPAVMTGYWHDPEATAAAFTPERSVRTGDLGWVDERGRLHLVGRSKEMYVRGGYNVFPVEVEAVLCAHPAVAEVAVVPRPDDVMGEVGVAVVVARDPGPAPTLEDLRSWGAHFLARHKLPEDLLVVDALPLTAMEKLDRRALAGMVAAPPRVRGDEMSPGG